MRQNIVSDQKICLLARSRQLSSRFGAKEFQQSWDSFLLCRASDILGGLNPQHGDTPGRKILQQVAVVAGDLNYQPVLFEVKSFGHLSRKFSGMTKPRLRKGR